MQYLFALIQVALLCTILIWIVQRRAQRKAETR